jgi:tRNA A37 threonylcarbamoyltransferase TsaD
VLFRLFKIKIKKPIIKETIHINCEINNIADILKLIDLYKIEPTIQYNINMQALHDIKEPLEELNNMIGMKNLKNNIVDQILYFIQKNVQENPNFVEENKYDICASVQNIIIEILMDKLKMAVAQTGIKQIAIGGGVSANSGIRNTLKAAEGKYGWKTYIPKFEYTTDNAAMIGIVGYQKYLQDQFTDSTVVSKARIEF